MQDKNKRPRRTSNDGIMEEAEKGGFTEMTINRTEWKGKYKIK